MGCEHIPIRWHAECDKCEANRLRAELAREREARIVVERERDAARRERDERPMISREDAATFTHWKHDLVRPDVRRCVNRIEMALGVFAAEGAEKVGG